MKLHIVKEFTDTPGGRTITEGDYSGELFRDTLLIPRYKESLKKKEKLEIYFDGAYGYPSCFLDEAFGGLVKECHEKNVLDNIIIIANDDLTIERRIRNCVAGVEKEIFGPVIVNLICLDCGSKHIRYDKKRREHLCNRCNSSHIRKDGCKHMKENGYCKKAATSSGYCIACCSYYEKEREES